MTLRAHHAVLGLALSLCSASCPDVSGGTPPAFDAERAWKDLLHQVELGPRPSGSEANERCRAWIETELRAAGLEPRREAFEDATPSGKVAFANVWAELPGTDAQAGIVALGAHFDTKRLEGRFVGANDGASGVAVLLEVARVLAKGPKRAVTYRFLFFDGEEAVRHDWAGLDNTYGSRHHVKGLKERGEIARLRAFVLLDMVGDKDLRLTRDTLSDRRLAEMFDAAAKRLDLGRHVGGRAMEVRDDHVPFLNEGVRALDLIDFDYGPDNAHWHTDQDVPENCSRESLSAIGRIVLAGLADLEQSLGPR
jgi:hypothetical protein